MRRDASRSIARPSSSSRQLAAASSNVIGGRILSTLSSGPSEPISTRRSRSAFLIRAAAELAGVRAELEEAGRVVAGAAVWAAHDLAAEAVAAERAVFVGAPAGADVDSGVADHTPA